MQSVIHSSRIAAKNHEDYEARSNIMWSATWALNTLISRGKSTDWMVHMLGQAAGAYTDATLILEGGYKVLNKEEVKAILKESLYFKA